MTPITGKERVSRQLQHKPVDRIAAHESFWSFTIQNWIDQGKMAPINPRHLLYMLWATTQHYADFGHQIQTLNDGKPLTERQWREAKASVKDMVLRGIGAI